MNKRSRKGILMRVGIVFMMLTVFFALFLGFIKVGEELQLDSQYKLIRPVYIMGVYDSLNNRALSSETASAYLHSKRYYDKSYVAFQHEVPAGTIITVIRKAPKLWYLPFLADRYFVALTPDLSNGLDVVLVLNRGIEGNLDGLNPGLFDRVK